MKLDFVCVGAQKAGTSTLHDILKQHPQIKLPVLKETHFFSDEKKFEKGIDFYFKNYFNQKSESKYIGEIDPEYSYFLNAANNIKKHFSSLKIIIIIRNPVDRAYSHYLMTKRRGLEPYSFKKAILEEEKRLNSLENKMHYSYISRGLYNNQINHYTNVFGSENVKVVLFKDLVEKTPLVVNDICNFINVPSYTFDYNIKSNTASESKSKWLRDFLYKPNTLKKVLGKLIPTQNLKDKIAKNLDDFNLKKSKKEPLEKSFKQEVFNTYFKQDIKALEENLNIDLSLWKTF